MHNIQNAIQLGFEQIFHFIETREFQSLLDEIRKTSKEDRKVLIRQILIDKNELKKRNIKLPEDLIMQRSKFSDNSLTLFCITKYISKDKKITYTFYENDL